MSLLQSLPEFETADIRLRDVCGRAQMGGNFKRSYNSKPGRKPKIKFTEPPALAPLTSNSNKAETFEPINSLQHKMPNANRKANISPVLKASTGLSYQHKENHVTFELDAFNAASAGGYHMLDNECELQEEVVCYSAETEQLQELEQGLRKATHSNSCDDESIPSFLIANDAATKTENVLQLPELNAVSRTQLPKLEPLGAAANDKKQTLPGKQQHANHLKPAKTRVSISPLPAANELTPELIQETHACFFSLIRDFFCATSCHRMRYEDLRTKIDIWLNNPITALNDWYAQASSWSALLQSAISFLAGDFPTLPTEYVPYIEHKVSMHIYQWIGAGRDSDARLSALCSYWMQRKNEHFTAKTMQQTHSKLLALAKSEPNMHATHTTTEESIQVDGIGTPPPPAPRYPTNWTVRPATSVEIQEFRRQERERFEQPHRAYTYKMFGYESVVGPVKGIYSQVMALTKARGHSMMVVDRPNFVTILTLVRDATARLPNGEGTRADISELLKCSQYISPDAAENVLQTIVSGALDRMHTEQDPCVRYDPKRKIWIYLHRNRSEAEFERMHQQQQSMTASNTNAAAMSQPPKQLKRTLSSTFSNSTAASTIAQRKTTLKTGKSVRLDDGSYGLVDNKYVSLPALVPANPIIVNNLQQQSQSQQQQTASNANAHKYPPVPPLKYNIPANQPQKSLLKARNSELVKSQAQLLMTKEGNTTLAGVVQVCIHYLLSSKKKETTLIKKQLLTFILQRNCLEATILPTPKSAN